MNLVIPEKLAPKRRKPWLPRAWRTPLALVGTVIALVWILVAILAPWIAPHDPLAQDLPRLAAPSGEAIMGTDVNGRDVFSRLLLGAQTTIPLALMLVVCAMVVGTIVGAVAGYLGGWFDEVLMRITDMVMAFPTVILAMVIAASLGPSIMNAVIAGIIVAWPPYARITRSLVLGLRTQNYVIAGRLSDPRRCARSCATCCRTSPDPCSCSPRSTSAPRSCCSRASRSSVSAPSRRRPSGAR